MAYRTLAISTAVITALLMASASFLQARPEPIHDNGERITFSEDEITRILQHALAPLPPDSTNKFADDPAAAHFGRFLFFDKRFSANQMVSCATCHDPARDFTDGKPFAEGIGQSHRHTPSLWNAAHNRWLFWDGRADTLWSQALDPIEQESEMGGNRLRVAHTIHDDPQMRRAYEVIFGPMPDLSDTARFPADARPVPANAEHPHAKAWAAMAVEDREAVNRVFANVGKAIAAYERRILIAPKSPFDAFVEGVKESIAAKQKSLSPEARRGLKLFVSGANCRLCHTGPNFTDGEFHNTGAPPTPGHPQDTGRFDGALKVVQNPFASTGEFSDDRDGVDAQKLKFLARTAENWGQFKTPSLRNVARTAPYMHQGQFASLREVVEFYSTRKSAVQIGHHQETILTPLNLSEQQISDLIAFLESLTGPAVDEELATPPDSPIPPSPKDVKP